MLTRADLESNRLRKFFCQANPGDRDLSAIAFVVRRDHPSYVGRLPLDTVLKIMVSARWFLGTPSEYLHETIHGLLKHGVRDAYLMEIRRHVITLYPKLAGKHFSK